MNSVSGPATLRARAPLSLLLAQGRLPEPVASELLEPRVALVPLPELLPDVLPRPMFRRRLGEPLATKLIEQGIAVMAFPELFPNVLPRPLFRGRVGQPVTSEAFRARRCPGGSPSGGPTEGANGTRSNPFAPVQHLTSHELEAAIAGVTRARYGVRRGAKPWCSPPSAMPCAPNSRGSSQPRTIDLRDRRRARGRGDVEPLRKRRIRPRGIAPRNADAELPVAARSHEPY